jgi:hypothetical protein
MKRFYFITRDLNLYFGLFISPFVLLYAVSVLFLVHGWMPGVSRQPTFRTVKGVELPDRVYTSNGRDQVNAFRPVLDNLALSGEMNFIRRISKEHRLVVPVLVPGRETTVDLRFATRTAVITERRTGTWDALVYLHKMPGPHTRTFEETRFTSVSGDGIRMQL